MVLIYCFFFFLDPDKAKENEEKKIDPINNYDALSANILLRNIVERKVDIKEFKPQLIRNIKESPQAGFPTVFTTSEVVI